MVVNCPTCAKSVPWNSDSEFRPFCCKKCQLIDLGEWASEEHKIAAKPSEQPSAKEVDIEEIEAMLAKQSDDFFKH
jgi:endogenous inhibitor of DNA gyrase (YacG/DUF329 family)